MMDRPTRRHGRPGGLGLMVALLLALMVLPELDALAIPKDPPANRVTANTAAPVLLARRRRRYPRRNPTRRRPPRRPPAPAPEPDPDPTPAAAPTPAGSDVVDPGSLRRGGRVEFDGRLVQGQTAKSGAIYLFARKRSELRSMVQERVNYRTEVLRTVFSGWETSKK